MELKTLTLSAGMYMLIYSFPPTHGQVHTTRHSMGIDTLTTGRKGINKELGGKKSSMEKKKGLCNNKKQLKSPNLQTSMKL